MNRDNTKFDIIIQGGQSNAEGMGVGPVNKELIPIGAGNVFYLESEKKVEHLPERVKITFADPPFSIHPAKEHGTSDRPIANFALPFGTLYEKEFLKNDRKLLVICAAVGGTGFVKGEWREDGPLYLKMLEMTDYALSLNRENRVVGFLWHQGECDAFEGNKPSVFKQQLLTMIQNVRGRYGEGIPFVAGDFVSEWKEKNLPSCIPIVEKIREVVNEAGNASFVETADLLSNNQKNQDGDDIHFCREAIYILGQRYFSAFRELNGKTRRNREI